MFIEILAFVTILVSYPIKGTWFDPTPEKARQEIAKGKKVVLLVHGYLHNSSAWHLFRRRLNEAGYLTYTVDLGSPFASIESCYVNRLQTKITKIREETGVKDIILVGHSMGGIVCCHYAYTDPHVTHVVTLGSPLLGTKSAIIGLGKSAKQMLPNSPFSQETLKKIEAIKFRTYFKFFGSASDLLISSKSAIPPISHTESQKYQKIHHFSYLYVQKVAHDTIQFLSQKN